MVKNGRLLLAIDGLDGSGKTTQIELLRDYLETQGKKVDVLQHSGGSEIGLLLRKISRSKVQRTTETDFYISLAMAYGLADSLSKNTSDIVIVDRSQLSMYAYNVVVGKLKDKKLGDQALVDLSELYRLDAILLLEVSEKTKRSRLQERNKTTDYFEDQTKSLQSDLLRGYQDGSQLIEKRYPDTKIIKIDANGSLDDVHNKIVETVKKML